MGARAEKLSCHMSKVTNDPEIFFLGNQKNTIYVPPKNKEPCPPAGTRHYKFGISKVHRDPHAKWELRWDSFPEKDTRPDPMATAKVKGGHLGSAELWWICVYHIYVCMDTDTYVFWANFKYINVRINVYMQIMCIYIYRYTLYVCKYMYIYTWSVHSIYSFQQG